MKLPRWLPALCAIAAAGLLAATVALLVQDARMMRGRSSVAGLAPRPANLAGINVALLDAKPAAQQAALQAIAGIGFGWVRQEFDWEKLPADSSAAGWPAAAALLQNTHAQGLRVIAVLSGAQPPADAQQYAQVAAEFASRFNQQVDAYEIWDEPNLRAGWGAQPAAASYLRLLQAAYPALHAARPGATVVLGSLSPSIDSGPDNISDLLFLRQLYAAGAAPFFDVASGKPYGFAADAQALRVEAGAFNFSRFILLREEMERAGDGRKQLWAGNFGWYVQPVSGAASNEWGAVSAARQAANSAAAFARARQEWPWAGVMALENWQPAGPSGSDPRWGFALRAADGSDSAGVAALQKTLATDAAPPGEQAAVSSFATYTGAWKFSALGADIPAQGPASVEFIFDGTELALRARRANYRAYIYAEVDGVPANALPVAADGRAYVVLTAPDLQPQVTQVTLARGLASGRHVARLVAERGWDQWAIAGFAVADVPPAHATRTIAAGVCAALAVLLAGAAGWGVRSSLRPAAFSRAATQLGERATAPVTAVTAAIFWLSAAQTWGQPLTQLIGVRTETLPVVLTVLSAGLFYFSPWLLLTVLSGAAMFVLLAVRPAAAAALVAFAAPFYLLPRPMFERMFSAVEVFTLLGAGAALLHGMVLAVGGKARRPQLTLLDWAVLAFAALGTASIFFAAQRAVAVTELRTTVLEPVLLYLLLRFIPMAERERWQVVDAFLAGALLVALVGLGQYASGTNLITAEDGVLRLRSVYGSPNNVGLYLGRALPVALAVALLGVRDLRGRMYAVVALPLAAALWLSFSRGALLLGVPAALAVVLLFWGGRRAWPVLAAAGAGGLLVLLLIAGRSPRFARLADYTQGPVFFRLQLWRSALAMVRDAPLTGVGLDNFLYAYRGRYIAPAAWQEPNLSHAHNWLLDFATRLGLPGLLLAGAMLAGFWQQARRALGGLRDPAARALAVGLCAAMVNVLAHGLVDASYWFVDLAFAFMLICGLMAQLGRMVNSPAAAVPATQASSRGS
ncbi:hypothetical protein EMGBD1_10280 [Anaerolineaceae bacterium]|nr:hypothetical protein EMGBD1_10280 [Anaerolineaceae bacterium]